MNKNIPAVLCIILLIGCGGGGGSSAAAEYLYTPPAPPVSTTPVAPSFDVNYSSSPDETIFNAVSQLEIPNCTLSRIQHTMIVDLNNDYHKDILMFVLCGDITHPKQGTNVAHDDSTPNTMIALLNDGYGSFEVNNIDVFGTNHVQIGGDKGGIAGFFTLLEDPNSGIGLPHITYMVSRDDHRRKRSDDWSNHFSQQGIFTADSNNTYNLVELGGPGGGQGGGGGAAGGREVCKCGHKVLRHYII